MTTLVKNLKKEYEGKLKNLAVMDDYDGGAANQLRMVIDDLSMSFLQGSIIDWIDTLVQTGFEIHNPNEESACGCGVSVGF